MSEEGNGDIPSSPPDAGALMVTSLAQFIGEFLSLHAPALDEDSIADLAVLVAHEQIEKVDVEIMPTLVAEDLRKYPTLIMGMHDAKDPELGVTVKGAKSITAKSEIGIALHSAMILALLQAPHIRALLRANGFVYTFGQSTETPETQRRIIM